MMGMILMAVGCATSPPARLSSRDRQRQRIATELEGQGDADSLAAAGLLRELYDRDNSSALLARATMAAPERAHLVWLQAQGCRQAISCDPELERQ